MKYLILLLMCISPIWLNAGVSEEMNPEIINNSSSTLTLMKGENTASVTIDYSSDAYFTIMDSPLMVENPPASDYGYNFIYRFEFR